MAEAAGGSDISLAFSVLILARNNIRQAPVLIEETGNPFYYQSGTGQSRPGLRKDKQMARYGQE